MLEDYIINEQIRYENHYLKVAQTDIEIGGVAGAALLSALIVDTEEGNRRGIAIDSDAARMAWIAKYEREVRRDEWGLIGIWSPVGAGLADSISVIDANCATCTAG